MCARGYKMSCLIDLDWTSLQAWEGALFLHRGGTRCFVFHSQVSYVSKADVLALHNTS